jgi:hypothetical protein
VIFSPEKVSKADGKKMRQREHIPLWISNDVADTCHISLPKKELIPSYPFFFKGVPRVFRASAVDPS